MKVVQVNSVYGSGSTGKICVAVSELLTANGIENYCLYAVGKSTYPFTICYANSIEIKANAFKAKVFGNYGFQGKSATKRLIKELERLSPDVIHLHNLHSHDVHLDMLCNFLKKKKVRLFWTFHDCWAFTGYCTHYDMIGCNRWKTDGCSECPQRKHYSWFVDRSQYLFERKKQLFSDLDMTIVTPSQWVADQVKQSFLKNKEVNVIYNGIDLSIFKPQTSNFRTEHQIEDKFILLGVAFDWGRRKGLDVFIELSRRLHDKYQIVLVGTDDKVDQLLPESIISIHRTHNQMELAELYTASDIFINPTREEVLGLTNIEALACGTPVITFNTGGSPECIDETCGFVVERDDIDTLVMKIEEVCTVFPFPREACMERAKHFDMKNRFAEYVGLYT